MRGKSTIDAIFIAGQSQGKISRRKQESVMVFCRFGESTRYKSPKRSVVLEPKEERCAGKDDKISGDDV